MGIEEKGLELKEQLLPRWVERFLSSYPLESSGFLRTRKDQFANPVGYITHKSLNVLYDAVMGADLDPQVVREALADLIQLRAIQNLTPTQIIGPLSHIKSIIHKDVLPLLKDQQDAKGLLEEYITVEARADGLLLLALEEFSARREKVFQMRVDEIKRSQSQVVRWAKLRGDEDSSRNCKSEG